MKADALSPRQMFAGWMHYEIPPFQRPYVWEEESQWAPLWADVLRVAESRLLAGDAPPTVPHHFLGAVVYESRPPIVGDVTRHVVIDGQQRTTTLQVLIDAVEAVLDDRDHPFLAGALEQLILNESKAFAGKPERFKLWPARNDRAAFEQAMDPQEDWTGSHRILDAHAFFSNEAKAWLTGAADADGKLPPGSEEERAAALTATLQDGLYLVAINLTGHDDSQLIFETLNDRGTPLLKADLIKNWLFQQGQRVGANVEAWPETHWVDFDDDWWRGEISQGRHSRSRIDIFMQYWLTMRRSDEVKTEQIFRVFTEHAGPHMDDPEGAERFLHELRRDADTYRSLPGLPEDSPQGSYYRRVVEAMELAATSPLLMWLLSDNHRVPSDQIRVALEALESWVIRRTLIRKTMKDVNKMMVAILKTLDRTDVSRAGDAVRDFLAAQANDSRAWPRDSEMIAQLPRLRLYGYIRQSRLRIVLEAIERSLRTQFHEAVSLPPGLEVEHVMPQTWTTYWNTDPPLGLEATEARNQRIQTLGNLTLTNRGLNGALSNRPWTDDEATDLKTGGDAGKGKRSLLASYSLLALSKTLIDAHPDAWTDIDIENRSIELTHRICAVWPGPPAGIEPITEPLPDVGETDGPPPETLPRVEWTADELRDLAAGTASMTCLLLDHVASHHAGTPVRGEDLADSGVTSQQVAGISGALARKVYGNFRRVNPPLEFVQVDGVWHYLMSEEVCALWLQVRQR